MLRSKIASLAEKRKQTRPDGNRRDRILPQVPIWAQRSRQEISDARQWCLTFAQMAQQLQQKSNSGIVTEIVQFALRTCASIRNATTFFYLLREAALSGGQLFSMDNVMEAEVQCFAALTGTGLARPFAGHGNADSSGDEGAGDDELSGEEAVDREEPLKATPELLADLGVELTAKEEAADNAYPAHAWQADSHLLQGMQGFNKRAVAAMRQAHVGVRRRASDKDRACPPLQPHQEIVDFLVHRKSPVMKLLVDHPTGSGKTREIIRVLDNFFFDPRPKIPIFPKAAVCRNFYVEMLRWPSRYRDYFCCERPADAWEACGSMRWQDLRHDVWDMNRLPESLVRHLCYSLREVLEMKGQSFRGLMRKSFRAAFREKHPGEPMPLAPLRAISYASAGGGFSSLRGGQPLSAVMKIGFRGTESSNVYSNKVVLMDETHNLVRTQTQYKQQLTNLRDLLSSAADLVLVGFTGTPILSVPDEGQQLLNLIKGVQTRINDEGFISSLTSRPRPLFPVSLPAGIPDEILTSQRQKQLVTKIELHGDTLNAYDRKRQRGLTGQRLRTYCNVCSFASSFHDGKSGNKTKILADPRGCCPKLLAVAEAVASSTQKAVVMTGRSSGFNVMLELLRKVAESSPTPFGVATMEELSTFNHVSNLHGEILRVLVADTVQCSEGVSFLAVRRAFITDVPHLHSSFVQMCGRSVRMYGHRGLPDKEQQVVTHLYASSLPDWMNNPLVCWAFRAQRRHWTGASAEQSAKLLLQRLNSLGFTSLSQLKSEVDRLRISDNCGEESASMASKRLKDFLSLIGHAETVAGPSDADEGKSSRTSSSAIVQAVRALASAQPADEAQLACALHLTASSADEDAIEDLARQSQELAPALSSMRSWAVDKDILDDLSRPGDRQSDQPVWSAAHVPARRQMSAESMQPLSNSTSLVVRELSPTMEFASEPRQRLRKKTKVESSPPTESMVPLCDGSLSTPVSCSEASSSLGNSQPSQQLHRPPETDASQGHHSGAKRRRNR